MSSMSDEECTKHALDWLSECLKYGDLEQESGGRPEGNDQKDVQGWLSTGVILCNVINIIHPGAVQKINEPSSNMFKQMENISNFLKASENYGCVRSDLFQSVHLHPGTDIMKVVGGILGLARRAQIKGWSGPVMGLKEATAN